MARRRASSSVRFASADGHVNTVYRLGVPLCKAGPRPGGKEVIDEPRVMAGRNLSKFLMNQKGDFL